MIAFQDTSYITNTDFLIGDFDDESSFRLVARITTHFTHDDTHAMRSTAVRARRFHERSPS